MKKINILLVLFFLGVALFTSCEKNADDDTYSGDPIIAFENSNGSISEADTLNTLSIPVFMAKTSEVAGTVEFMFDTVGIANPAIEGEDFELVNSSKTLSIAAGEYYANIILKPIDNSLYEGNKSVKVVLTSGSGGAVIGYNNGESNVEFSVTLIDNEHPLAFWIGSYTVSAASQGSPGAWDESWSVSTFPNPDNENQLLMTGIAGASDVIISTLDLSEMTITIKAGQILTDYSYGNYGTIGIQYGTYAGGVVDGHDLEGTISNDGTIIVNNWIHQFVEGPNVPDVWDAFNCTFNMTKGDKSSAFEGDYFSSSKYLGNRK